MSLEIAGACRWSGLSEADAHRFLCLVAKHGPMGNEDAAERAKTVRRTYVTAAQGCKVTGWPSLASRVGQTQAERVRDVLLGKDRWQRLTDEIRRGAANDTEEAAANDTEEAAEPATEPSEVANPLRIMFGGLDAQEEPVEWLVEGIIPKSSVALFVAEPYTLKSFTALDVAVAIAHGRPWLGKHATKQGRAVVVNFEMHDGELRRRLRLLGDTGGGLVGRCTHPDLALDDEAFWTALEALAPDLVVIDTLSAGNPDVEEKDPRAANPMRRAARMANGTGCTFLFVHHTTKDTTASKKNRVRGTGAIFGAADACFFFEQVGTTGATAIECIKMRCGASPGRFLVKLSDARGLELENESSTATKATSSKPQDIDAAIRLQLSTRGGATARDLATALGKRPSTITDRLEAMKERGEAIHFDRAWHLDGDKQRRERVLDAVRADRRLRTITQVAKAAHVLADDVAKLEREGLVWKTSNSEVGTYVCEGC